jgi:hypothetical protein
VQLTKVLPAFGTDPGDWRAWRDLEGTPDDEYQVDAYSPNPDGTYNVTLRVGLDGAAEEPIARFVAAHAAETLRLSDRYGKRRVTSVSAEGQSVSYEASPSASQNRSSQKAGELPDITTLSRYKEVPVFVRQKFRRGPWPYGPSHLSGW